MTPTPLDVHVTIPDDDAEFDIGGVVLIRIRDAAVIGYIEVVGTITTVRITPNGREVTAACRIEARIIP